MQDAGQPGPAGAAPWRRGAWALLFRSRGHGARRPVCPTGRGGGGHRGGFPLAERRALDLFPRSGGQFSGDGRATAVGAVGCELGGCWPGAAVAVSRAIARPRAGDLTLFQGALYLPNPKNSNWRADFDKSPVRGGGLAMARRPSALFRARSVEQRCTQGQLQPRGQPCGPSYPRAAVTISSTFNSGVASFASPQARAGAWPSGTQASQTLFISAKSAMSASQITHCRMRVGSDPASASSFSIFLMQVRVWSATLSPGLPT